MYPRAMKLCSALSAVCLLVGLADAGQKSMKMVRAGADGARARNFQDQQGLIVRQIPAGELLRVHGEDVGFLDVEVSGGLQVWVFGEFLEEEVVEGAGTVLRVTTSRVNMRPRPGASTANMPIRTKLNLGDRVRLIERADPSKPLAEDWVRVWSPRTSRAWVSASETEPVANMAAANSEWQRSAPMVPAAVLIPNKSADSAAAGGTVDAAGTQVPATNSTDSGSGAGVATGVAELAAADRLYDSMRDDPMADFGPVIAAYELALKEAIPGSTNAELAARRVQEAQVRKSHIELKQQMAGERQSREAQQAELQLAGETRELASTPNWGRFDTRGWITRRTLPDGERYIVEWRGDVIAEIVCTTGRYDLALFDGFEVGVVGKMIEESRISADRLIGYPKVIDASAIEVISGSGLRRAR
ncbi:MAG: hypothetical protein ACI8QZ_003041 [Chlamydiales bacterium]|jgi:hypothetical protein